MKHLILSSNWRFEERPFPSFHCNIIYGKHKRDSGFIPTIDMSPKEINVVTISNRPSVLYKGMSFEEAQKIVIEHNSNPENQAKAVIQRSGELPEGEFGVIKSKLKGTWLIVPRKDTSNKCLLFVGCNGGHRGGVSLMKYDMSAAVIKECIAGNRRESAYEVAAVLEPEQNVVFRSYGQSSDEIIEYFWSGKKIYKRKYPKSVWDNRKKFRYLPVEDIEVE